MRKHKRKSKFKYFIILLIFSAALIVFVTTFNNRTSISTDKFVSIALDTGYQLFDINDETSHYKTKLEYFDNYKAPILRTSVVYGDRTEICFMEFKDQYDAAEIEKRYENSQKLVVYRNTNSVDDYMNDTKSIKTQKGDNYQRYYTKTLKDEYYLISQIDNTLLVATISIYDIEAFNKMMNKMGY